jgi:hypothetical protein
VHVIVEGPGSNLPLPPKNARNVAAARLASFCKLGCVFISAGCAGCSPSGGPVDVGDAEAEHAETDVGALEDRRAESIDVSVESLDDAASPGDEVIPDEAVEAGQCLDVFGPVYVPDADDATACTASSPCDPIYICFGLSCDDRWECLPHHEPHPCPKDWVPHCGCDGVTFYASSSCADRPYLHIGACGDGANCDPTDLRCNQPEPSCAPGSLASVVNGVYGPCIPFASCRCEYHWECPHREKYACDRTTWRCAERTDAEPDR